MIPELPMLRFYSVCQYMLACTVTYEQRPWVVVVAARMQRWNAHSTCTVLTASCVWMTGHSLPISPAKTSAILYITLMKYDTCNIQRRNTPKPSKHPIFHEHVQLLQTLLLELKWGECGAKYSCTPWRTKKSSQKRLVTCTATCSSMYPQVRHCVIQCH